MKKYFSLLLLFCTIALWAQERSYTLYLVGDAGEDTVPGTALLRLKNELIVHPNSAVLFLGDNVYPAGLKINDPNSVKRLESQLQILKEYKGDVFFIPGNHDWEAQKRNGLSVLKDQQLYVTDYLKKNSTVKNKNEKTFLPENGLPGPETIMLNEKLRLIIIDTQWFLHYYKKNTKGSKAATQKRFYKELDSIIQFAVGHDEQVIVAAHHPVYTNGDHSKRREPLRFLINYTPFQVFGLLGVNRWLSQDIHQPRYKRMRKKLTAIFTKYPDKITYVSGHDHNLQLIKKDHVTYVVSGGGSKLSKLRKKAVVLSEDNKLKEYDHQTGFIEIIYDQRMNAEIKFNLKE